MKELLQSEAIVRAVVRSDTALSALEETFRDSFERKQLEVVIVPNLTAKNAFVEHLQGNRSVKRLRQMGQY